MVVRYPQPPGDEGSRKRLANRKASVSDVAKGYVGIVNIYQLVPKGAGAVPVVSLGIPPPPPGAKIYPQKPSKKTKPTAGMLDIEKKLSIGHTDVGWKYDGSERQYRLAVREGNTFGHFITPARSYTQKDRDAYESEYSKHPNLIVASLDKKKLGNALKQLEKVEDDPTKFDEMLVHQMMNLQTTYNTLKNLYMETKAARKRKAEEVIDLGEAEPTMKEAPSPKVSRSVTLLPSVLQGSRQISSSVANDPSRGFIRLDNAKALQVYNTNPNALKYVEDRGEAKYYLDTNVTERKRRSSKMKIKRKPMTKSGIRKQALLKKMRCKCHIKKRRH